MWQVSPLELANLYATIANGGTVYPSYLITKIINAKGQIDWEHKVTRPAAPPCTTPPCGVHQLAARPLSCALPSDWPLPCIFPVHLHYSALSGCGCFRWRRWGMLA